MAEEKKQGTGLSKNIAGALAYVLGPVSGVVFLLIEKDPFVKFHAVQSIVIFLGLFILQSVLGMTLILLPLVPLIGIIMFILWLVLIFKAYQGQEWEVPFVGKFVRSLVKKVK